MVFSPDQLSDIEDIRACAIRYCRGVDRLDPAIMRSAYWPDATDDHGVFKGNAWEFVDRCMTSHLAWRSTMHCIFNHAIEFDDAGIARGEIYNITYLFQHDGSLDTWHGRYLDIYEKRKTGDNTSLSDTQWRIKSRICVHEGTHANTTLPMQIDAKAFRQGESDRGNPTQIGS